MLCTAASYGVGHPCPSRQWRPSYTHDTARVLYTHTHARAQGLPTNPHFHTSTNAYRDHSDIFWTIGLSTASELAEWSGVASRPLQHSTLPCLTNISLTYRSSSYRCSEKCADSRVLLGLAQPAWSVIYCKFIPLSGLRTEQQIMKLGLFPRRLLPWRCCLSLAVLRSHPTCFAQKHGTERSALPGGYSTSHLELFPFPVWCAALCSRPSPCPCCLYCYFIRTRLASSTTSIIIIALLSLEGTIFTAPFPCSGHSPLWENKTAQLHE
jgi:hypothetical protein